MIAQSELKQELISVKHDIVCGLHSGFPPCCVKFYITKWIWNLGSKTNHKHWNKLRDLDKTKKYSIDYIPCPKCVKNKTFVELKRCPKNCSKKKWVKSFLKKRNKNVKR